MASPVRRRSRFGLALLTAALLVGAAAGAVAMRRQRNGPLLYRPVSFHRGSLGVARFAPDEKTILYTAAWQGHPPQLYSTRLDSTESTALPLPSANLLSISSGGKLAILVLHGNDPAAIAEVSLAGGAPRELVASDPPEALMFAQGVADWSPDGERLAVVRDGALEFPVGKVLVPASEGQVLGIRFSPDGRRIAYAVERGPSDLGRRCRGPRRKQEDAREWLGNHLVGRLASAARARSGFPDATEARTSASSSCTPSRSPASNASSGARRSF